MSRKILVATDFSALSFVGVRYAIEMAMAQGLEVIVYHVIPVGDGVFSKDDGSNPGLPLIAQEERRLDHYLNESFPEHSGRGIHKMVGLGTPYKSIVEKAVEEGADMIVMSTHGRSGFNHVLLGSVAEKVIAHASCPVLVVPPSNPRLAR